MLKKDVRIIVEDYNGNNRLLGAYNGVECTKLEYTTGGGYSDLNGVSLSFEAAEREEALFIGSVPNNDFQQGRFLLLQDGTYLLFEGGSLIELEF